jgi:hypothetical protein
MNFAMTELGPTGQAGAKRPRRKEVIVLHPDSSVQVLQALG